MVAPTQFVIRDVQLVSFIIPAWNEESVLPSALAAVTAVARRLAGPGEIIVVDDASTDRTAEIARAGGASVVSANHRQIAAARNAGAKAARGDLFIFIDADTVIAEDVVQAALESVRRGAVGGGCAFRFDGQVPLYARVLQEPAAICGRPQVVATQEPFRSRGYLTSYGSTTKIVERPPLTFL